MKNKLLTNNWILSFISNVAILAIVLLCTNMVYETSDDYAISSRIAAGYPFVVYVNYFLCKPLTLIAKLLPGVNIFVVMMVIASFIAFTALLKTIFDHSDNRIIRALSVLVIGIFSIDHYCTIQFTKTSALLTAVGTIMIIDVLIRNKKRINLIFPFILLYWGTMIRIDSIVGAVGFCLIVVITFLIDHRKEIDRFNMLDKKNIIIYIMIIVLFAGTYMLEKWSLQKNISTDELKYSMEYNEYRSNIVDYPTYEYYEQNKEKYDNINISKNDIYLINKWWFDYDGAASLENLKKIDNIDRPSKSLTEQGVNAIKRFLKAVIHNVKMLSFTGIHILLLSVLALFAIITRRKTIYVVAIGIATIGMYAAIYFNGRVGYRVLYVADIEAISWLLYILSLSEENRPRKSEEKKNSIVFPVATIVICLLLLIPLYSNCTNSFEKAKAKVMPSEVEQYFANHKENLYVWSTKEKKNTSIYLKPWMIADGRDSNITGTGSWGALSPYLYNKIEPYGVKNPIKGLVDHDNIFYVGNKDITKITEYFNKWYNDGNTRIEFKKVQTIEGNSIWKLNKH